MSKKRTIDIIDLLPEDAVLEVTKLGYRFLKENGYDMPSEIPDKVELRELKNEMRLRHESLWYKGSIDSENKKILVWYYLYRNGRKAAQSKGMTFVLKEDA